MKNFVLCLLTLLVAIAAHADGDALPVVVAPRAAQADRFLEDAARFGFAGQVLIAVDGNVILHKPYGFADRAARRPVTAATTFGIASMSKMFTAAAILKAQEEKLLGLDDPISKYLPNVPAGIASITIAQLLAHTSGIAAGYTDDFGDPSVDALVKRILEHAPAGKPGAAWRYASEGYVLLAAIVERAAGRPFDDYVRETIFKPAGMRTAWFVGEHDPYRTAPSHAYNGLRDNGSPADWPVNPRYVGAGSVVANASDLYRWASALWGGRVLAPESLAAMLTTHARMGEGDEFGYGMFLFKTENGAFVQEHGGDTALGFNGVVRWYPSTKTILVITCNVMSVGSASYRAAVQPVIAKWLETGAPIASDGVDWIAPSRAAALAGTYAKHAAIVFDGANAWLALNDQELLDAARKATPEQRAVYAADNRKTAALLAAMRQRDLSGLDSVDPSAREEMLADWKSALDTNGGLLDFAILGTTPQGKTTRTFARLRFVNGDATMVFRWGANGEGPLVAWNPRAQRYPMLVALAAKGDSLLARDLLGVRGPWRVRQSASGLSIVFDEGEKPLGTRSVAGWMP